MPIRGDWGGDMRKLTRRWTAVAAAWLLAGAAQADVAVSGNFYVHPSSLPIGPGNTDLSGNTLALGSGGSGSLQIDNGSWLKAASVRFADGGSGIGTGLVTGAGSRLTLNGNGNTNRLELGAWGQGRLTIADGATLDGRADSALCLQGAQWCHNFVGNAAGSDALLTITGAGSSASLLRAFVVGGLAVFRPPIETFTFGTPGGVTRGRVEVLNGGSLTTDGAKLGVAPGGSSPLGSERSFASVIVDGPGSIWTVTGATLDGGGTFVNLAEHANAWGTLSVTGGGQMLVQGKDGVGSSVNVGSQGGRGEMSVSGAGSNLLFTGDAGILKIGRNNSTGAMRIDAGGQASGMYYLNVGRDGGHGELTVDGTGSRILVNGQATAAANSGNANNPAMDIGRNGTGVVTVSNGGRIDLIATSAQPNGTSISLGREAASSGTLNISGAGSVVSISAASTLAGGGAAEALNPTVRIGRDGSGFLSITGGGKLLIDGQAVSTPTHARSTSLLIGGSSDVTPGGRGIALVSGAGSEILMTGNDTYIGVGHGPQSFGQLTVANQASVSAIGMNVGRSGGVGMLNIDHASLNFSGQQTGGTLSGAFLSIGRSGGVGVANISNGSQVTIHNLGNLGASLNLGGTSTGAWGDGTLTLSGGSRISIEAAPGKASMTVARDGSGLMRIKGGSSVDVLGGGVFVGRQHGSDGTLLMSEGSSLTTSWLGVGRDRTATGSVDGGTGTLVVNNSTLTADTIVIGSNGFLGGSGTIVGNVINYGIFSPGNSPGQMRIEGGFTAAAGSRLILEVQADGSGYRTDSVVFGNGGTLDLSQLAVEFRFLGNTNPNAFLASGGFTIGTFFQQADAGGVSHGLDPASFAGARFSAQADAYQFSNFSFSAASGAVFTAQAVPEPGQVWMALLGLAALARVFRRRQVGEST